MTSSSSLSGSTEASATEPLQTQLNSTIKEFSDTAHALFQAAASRQNQIPPLPNTANKGKLNPLDPGALSASLLLQLSVLDRRLASLVHLSIQHLANQKRINQLISEIKNHDQGWKSDIVSLHSANERMSQILQQSQKDLDTIDAVSKAQLDAEDILALGRRLAPFSSAPPSFNGDRITSYDPSTIPLHVRPSLPFPTEEVMRRGILAAEEPQATEDDMVLGQVKRMDAQVTNNVAPQQRPEEVERTRQQQAPRVNAFQRAPEQSNGVPADSVDPFDLDI